MTRVYFIKPIGMQGPVKIGCSYSPDSRRDTLRYWSPFPLEIVAEIEGDFRIERQFHALFVDTYISHEWFNWSPELQAVIDAVAAGTFDLATLPDPALLPRKARNNSYATAGWKYERSVHARLQAMRRSGVQLRDTHPIYMLACEASECAERELPALRAKLEPLIAELKARTPQASLPAGSCSGAGA
jgi:hypothetical protein